MNDKKRISKDAVAGARFVWKTPVLTILGSELTQVGKRRKKTERVGKRKPQGPS